MSVVQLRAPVVAGHIANARRSLEEAAAVPVGSLDRFELAEAVAGLHAVEAQAAALKLAVMAEAERRSVAEETADTGADAWAARLTGSTRSVMAGGISLAQLAQLLSERYDATREAFAAGHIDEAQVRVIVRAAQKIPDSVSEEDRVAAEEALVGRAVGGMNARRLRNAARRMLEVVNRDLPDEVEADQLNDQEEHAEAETWLRLDDREDGTVAGRFIIPELQAHLFKAALERLSAPRRWSRNKAGVDVVDDAMPGIAGLNYTERLGGAFVELLEHLPTRGHGASGTTGMVHIEHQHLLDEVAAAQPERSEERCR